MGSYAPVSPSLVPANKLMYYLVFQSLRTFAPLESNRRTMKSASGKRPLDETHGTVPHSKVRLNFVKHFRNFAVNCLFSKCCVVFTMLVQNSQGLMDFFGISAICTEKFGKISKSLRFSFFGISQRQKMIFEKSYKQVRKKGSS